MTTVPQAAPGPDSDCLTAAKQQAVHWLIRLNAGDLSEQETQAFADWLSQDYRHSEALAAVEQVFQDMTTVATLETRAAPALSIPRDAPGAELVAFGRHRLGGWSNTIFAVKRLAIAAALLLAVSAVSPLGSRWLDSCRSDYRTATGEQREIELVDGSRLLMNTDTAVSVDADATVRRLKLYRGQARFWVAADRNRPFEVQAGDLTVRALGTIFEVYVSQSGETRILVQEHAVAVSAGASDRREVGEGQQLDYRPGQALAAAEPADLDQATAWQQGQLTINDRPLAELIADLERYRSGRILLAGADLAKLRVTGVFPLSEPDRILSAVRTILHLRQTDLGPWLTILHR